MRTAKNSDEISLYIFLPSITQHGTFFIFELELEPGECLYNRIRFKCCFYSMTTTEKMQEIATTKILNKLICILIEVYRLIVI